MDTASQPPPLLYMYRPGNNDEFDRQLIADNKAWFSSPEQLNDPFERRPHVVWNTGIEHLYSKFSATYLARMAVETALMPTQQRRDEISGALRLLNSDKAREHFKQGISAELERSFHTHSIRCFAESSVDIRMWSYYARDHSGYCLGFNFDEPWSYVHMSGVDVRLIPRRVIYSRDYPEIDPNHIDDDPEIRRALYENVMLRKSDLWAFESEWRLVRPSAGKGLQSFPASSLRQLVLGARIDPNDRARLCSLASERAEPIEVLQCELARDSYSLRLVTIRNP